MPTDEARAAIVFFVDHGSALNGKPSYARVGLQRKDWLHPDPAMRNRLSGFGGVIEEG